MGAVDKSLDKKMILESGRRVIAAGPCATASDCKGVQRATFVTYLDIFSEIIF